MVDIRSIDRYGARFSGRKMTPHRLIKNAVQHGRGETYFFGTLCHLTDGKTPLSALLAAR